MISGERKGRALHRLEGLDDVHHDAIHGMPNLRISTASRKM